MKVQIKNKEKKFNSFQIIVEIETLDELKELWCRLNLKDTDVKELNSSMKGKEFNNSIKVEEFIYDGIDHTYDLFDLIDDKLMDILKD